MTNENLIFDKSADRTQTLVRLCIGLSLAFLGLVVLNDLLVPWLTSLRGGLLAGRVGNAGVAVALAAGLTVAVPPTQRWRETLWACLAAMIAGAQCALALLGAAVLSVHWQPELATSVLPGLAGMLAAAPVTLGIAVYFIRRRNAALRNRENTP